MIDKSDVLLSLNFISVYHKSTASTINAGQTEIIHNFSNWSNFDNDKYAQAVFANLTCPVKKLNSITVPQNIVISFMRNNSGDIYFWLFNSTGAFKININ